MKRTTFSKYSKIVKVRLWTILSLFCVLPIISNAQTSSTPSTEQTPINLDQAGWGTRPARSLQAPFTAVIESGILTIQSEDVSCDLTICITDCQSGNVVYSMEVPQGNGSLITIPTDGWGSGRYYLTIFNPEMGYVFGYFSL